MSALGYVVVEFNQVGGQPTTERGLFDHREDAEDVMEQCREETARVGRRECFAVGTVTIEEDDE